MPIKCKPYLGPDDPVIIEALSPVHRSSQTIFFLIGDDGKHTTINVGERLHALGISWANVAMVIQRFPFKMLTYQSPSKLAIAAGKGKPKGHGPQAAFEDTEDDGEVEEEVPEIAGKKKRQRYVYIETNSGKYGVMNAEEGRVISLFLTRREALGELARLRAGSSQAGAYHFGSSRMRTQDLQEVHY
jgi:hypothetical protein